MNIFRLISRQYEYITRSIAFYPTLIALFYIVIFLILLFVNQFEWLHKLNDWLSFLTPESLSSPESLLSTLIGGMISLMVLSFSMVMVVLSQAMNNYSPKLITGIVSEKSHQLVLGNFLGVLLFYILVLSTLTAESYSILAVIIAISILMAIWSIVLFIFFIHIVSTSIKINEICKNVFKVTKHGIEQLEFQTVKSIPDYNQFSESSKFLCPISGYLHEIDCKDLSKIFGENKWLIVVHYPYGTYLNKGEVLGSVYAENLSEKTIAAITDYFIFNLEESLEDNVVFGFTQLMEVAIKALSPGINDPGTAHICINYLTDLFIELIGKEQEEYLYQEQVYWPSIRLEKLLQIAIVPIIQYGKSDIGIMLHTKRMLLFLQKQTSKYPRFQQFCHDMDRQLTTYLQEIPTYHLALFQPDQESARLNL